MPQSMNTKVDLVDDSTFFGGLNSYGKVMIGDNAFEYYNDRNVNDYVQIPWEVVDYIAAEVYRKGKYIPRYTIHVKTGGDYIFASKNPRAVLRACRNYVPEDRLVHSLTLAQTIKRNLKARKEAKAAK